MHSLKKVSICSVVGIGLLTVLRVYPTLIPAEYHKWLSVAICVLAVVVLVTLLKMGRNLVAICIGVATFCTYGVDSLQVFGLDLPSILQYIEKIIQMRG